MLFGVLFLWSHYAAPSETKQFPILIRGERPVLRQNRIGNRINKTINDRADRMSRTLGGPECNVVRTRLWLFCCSRVCLEALGSQKLPRQLNSSDCLCGASLISMVKSTDLWNLNDPIERVGPDYSDSNKLVDFTIDTSDAPRKQ